MPREIKVDDDAFRIRYSGLSLWVLLLREVVVPYGEIQEVEVGLGPLPRFYVRIGQYIPKRSIRGRFKRDGKWSFIDVRGNRERAIVVRTLPGSRYAMVAVEPSEEEDSQAIAEEIRPRL